MSTPEKEIPIARYTLFYTPSAGPDSFILRQRLRVAEQQGRIRKSKNSMAECIERKEEAEGLLQWNINRKAELEAGLVKIKASLKIATETKCKPSELEHQDRSIKEIRDYVLDYKLEIMKRDRRIKEFSADIIAITSEINSKNKLLEKRKEVLASLQSTLRKIEANQALISKQSTLKSVPPFVDENTRSLVSTNQGPTF